VQESVIEFGKQIFIFAIEMVILEGVFTKHNLRTLGINLYIVLMFEGRYMNDILQEFITPHAKKVAICTYNHHMHKCTNLSTNKKKLFYFILVV